MSRQSKTSLIVLQERKLGLTLLAKSPRCAPFDNGQENREHHLLKDEIGVDTYLCNPYSSWEK